MVSYADLSTENPNLRQQYQECDARAQNGENPTESQAIRQHVLSPGAPDPGEQAIADFGVKPPTSSRSIPNKGSWYYE
jgi:hypothetical protein